MPSQSLTSRAHFTLHLSSLSALPDMHQRPEGLAHLVGVAQQSDGGVSVDVHLLLLTHLDDLLLSIYLTIGMVTLDSQPPDTQLNCNNS